MKRLLQMLYATVVCLLFASMFLMSCGEKGVNNSDLETLGDYDLLYIHADGIYNDTIYALYTFEYSTSSGDLEDTIITKFYINDLRFTHNGNSVVMSVTDLNTAQFSVLAANYPAMDTLGFFEEGLANTVYFSPDEQEVLSCQGDAIAILSFPDLSPIYNNVITNIDGGFLTSNDSAFYLIEGVDSIFIIDYTDRQNVVTSSITTKTSESDITLPVACAVDYVNERMVVVTADELNYTHIQTRNSRNIDLVQSIRSENFYNRTPAFRPNSDEVFLMFSFDFSNESDNLVDVYDISSNSVSEFLRYDDVSIRSWFAPRMFEFTPDGEEAFILMGSNAYSSISVLGIGLSDGKPNLYMEPESGANGQVIRINPINKSK